MPLPLLVRIVPVVSCFVGRALRKFLWPIPIWPPNSFGPLAFWCFVVPILGCECGVGWIVGKHCRMSSSILDSVFGHRPTHSIYSTIVPSQLQFGHSPLINSIQILKYYLYVTSTSPRNLPNSVSNWRILCWSISAWARIRCNSSSACIRNSVSFCFSKRI